MARVPIDRVIDRLWPAGPDELTYAIFDGARNPDVVPLVMGSKLPARCLYVGDIDPALVRVAPHLVRLSRNDPKSKALIERAWGESWGIFLRSTETLEGLHRHFRRFLRVRDEEGRRMLFRYYDPRVFRVYVPTCVQAELDYVFGPVEVFVVEGDEPERILEMRNRKGMLAMSEVRIEKRLNWLGDYLRKTREE